MSPARPPRRRPGDRVTVEDVARVAGVSTATVSRVVNRNPSVGAEARAAVERAIEQLGYVPNRAARALMTRRTDSIAVVILETADRLFGDPFFGQLMRGISAELAAVDRQLVVLTAPDAEDEARVERYLTAGHVDGAIVVGPHGTDPLPARLARGRLPVVVNGRPPDGGSEVTFIDSENRAGAREAVEHLVALGRRAIATVHGTLDLTSGLDRLNGFRDALRAAGREPDPSLEAGGAFSPVTAAEATRDLLDRRPDLDAIFVASDSMAAAVMRVLQAAGRRVPEDVAVVGFDDSPVALECRPALTTVRQPIESMGREMVRQLLRRVDHPDDAPHRVVFGTELVVRGSTVAAAGDRG